MRMLGQLAVRDADERAVRRADLRRAHADPLHVAREVLDPHQVAHAEGLVGGERDRAEQVLDRLLRAEGDRDAADAEPREDGGHRVAEGAERRDEPGDRDEHAREVARHREQGAGRRVVGRPRPLVQVLGPDVHGPPQHPEDADRRHPAEQRAHGGERTREQPEPGQEQGRGRHGPQQHERGRGPGEQPLVPLRRRAPEQAVEQARRDAPEQASRRER